MTDPGDIASFLMEFVLHNRCLKINISALYGDSVTHYHLLVPTIPATANNAGFVLATPATMIPLTVASLSAKVEHMGLYTFTLQLVDTTSYVAATVQYTSEFRIAGKWLKCFGLNLGMNTTGMYIS